MNAVAKIEIPYVQAFKDRHGRQRYYFRRRGRAKTPLPGHPGSADFMAAYAEAAGNETPTSAGQVRTRPKTINALIVAYYVSAGFNKKLSPGTQIAYRRQIEAFRKRHGDKSALTIQPKHFDAIFEAMQDTPAQASNLRKRLRSIFKVAVKLGWRNDNPVRETESLALESDGFTPWTEEDIAAYEAKWPSGTRERLAMAILLYTGVRRSDAVKIGRQHISEGFLTLRQTKTGGALTVPIHPALQAEFDLAPTGMTFLLTNYGKPFSPAGFTSWFVGRAERAGIIGKGPHGLRKAQGRRLAESGASDKEIAAGLGHRSTATVGVYTRDAEQKRLAAAGMNRLKGAKPEQPVSTRFDTVVARA